jgi:hypothetical protein
VFLLNCQIRSKVGTCPTLTFQRIPAPPVAPGAALHPVNSLLSRYVGIYPAFLEIGTYLRAVL